MLQVTLKLDERQLRDLQMFLEQTSLRGAEAPRFMSLAMAIREAEIEARKQNNSGEAKKEVDS